MSIPQGALPQPALISLYGILIAAALAIAAWLCTLEERRLKLPKDSGLDIVLYALPPALIVARLYYVAFTWQEFAQDPIRALYFWEGGLAIYGAVIGGAIGVWLLSRRRRLSFAKLADIVAPALLLGQAIGRWGNYFNGEAYGYLVSNPRLQFFPFAVQVAGEWHLATFFYESMWNLLGFLFLYLNRRRVQAEGKWGRVFLWYLIWYGFGRLFIEGLRTDSLMLGSIRVSQLLSLLMCVASLAALIIRRGMPKPLLALPAAALVLPLIVPGWWGVILAGACILCAAVITYFDTYKGARRADQAQPV